MSRATLAHYQRRDGWLGAQFRYLAQTTSTNDVARELAEQGMAEGLVVLAEEQTAGRGRLQRRWSAPVGSSLLISLLFRPPEPFAYYAARTTMLCGLALVAALDELTALPVELKWPNDLIVTRGTSWRKLAGMLSEIGMVDARPAYLIVGIGLNVNIPAPALPELAPNATSLSVELGRTVARESLLTAFLQHTETRYERLRAGWEPLSNWQRQLAWLGQAVQLQAPTETIYGVAKAVDQEGALLLTLSDGSIRSFPVGDITLRPANR
ncbi:MAG: biotin--[acetyl-CoA-carboxylase] ligase [Chloroflexota bacterium]|nr:biotin--[acetyl-CoA-carboxylase] ligase [Chloroflexota bacterium]